MRDTHRLMAPGGAVDSPNTKCPQFRKRWDYATVHLPILVTSTVACKQRDWLFSRDERQMALDCFKDEPVGLEIKLTSNSNCCAWLPVSIMYRNTLL